MKTAIAIDRFPVLGLSLGHLIAFPDLNALTTCGEAGWKSGFFKNLVLLDADGNKYQVKGTRRIGTVGPLGGFRLIRSRKIRIELDFAALEKLTLEEAKEWVSGMLSASESIDVDRTRDEIQRAATYAEIVELFY